MGCASLEKSVACWVHNVTQSFIQEVLITDLICQFAPCWIMFPALQPFRVEIGLIYLNLNVKILFFSKQREMCTITLKIEIYSHSPSNNFLSKNLFKYLFYNLALNYFLCRKLLKGIDQSLRFLTQFDNICICMKTVKLIKIVCFCCWQVLFLVLQYLQKLPSAPQILGVEHQYFIR